MNNLRLRLNRSFFRIVVNIFCYGISLYSTLLDKERKFYVEIKWRKISTHIQIIGKNDMGWSHTEKRTYFLYAALELIHLFFKSLSHDSVVRIYLPDHSANFALTFNERKNKHPPETRLSKSDYCVWFEYRQPVVCPMTSMFEQSCNGMVCK